jgi:protein-disulfide isomerase
MAGPVMVRRLSTPLAVFALALCSACAAPPLEQDTSTRHLVPIGGSPVRGSARAPVTVVEFSDFQCPYCQSAQTTLANLGLKYADRLRIVFKQMPIARHQWAEPAAELSIEARTELGDDGFWRAHDALWPLQPSLSAASLERLGADLGLDAALVAQSVYQKRHADVIKQDVDLAIGLAIDATPCFFINGRQVVGDQPFDFFVQIIDEEITFTDTLVSKGVDPANVYDEILRSVQPAP